MRYPLWEYVIMPVCCLDKPISKVWNNWETPLGIYTYCDAEILIRVINLKFTESLFLIFFRDADVFTKNLNHCRISELLQFNSYLIFPFDAD